MAAVSFDLGIPKLIHKWGDARLRRRNRSLRDDKRELKAEVKVLKAALRTCKKRRRQLERDLSKVDGSSSRARSRAADSAEDPDGRDRG